MTKKEIEEYKKTAKVGDRLSETGTFSSIWNVRQVVERGVVISLRKASQDHEHLMEWNSDYLKRHLKIIHKEL